MSSSIRKKLEGKHSKLSQSQEQLSDHPAVDNYADGSFRVVPIDMVHPDPNQPRKIFDSETLKELSDSINQKGVLQPVIIRVDTDEKIWLVAGERRFRAAKMAGLEQIPAIITTDNPAEISLIENLQRDDLKPIEEAEALYRMINEYNYTQEQLAQVIGKAQSTISETLSLVKLSQDIRDEYRRADIPRRLWVEVSKLKEPEAMKALLKKIQEGNLKSDQVRKITRKIEKRTQRTPTAIALDRTLFLSNTLLKIDLTSSEETEKSDLLIQLQSLRKIIDKLLN